MEITFKKDVTENVKYLQVDAGVRYWENAEVNGVDDEDGNLIPLKDGERWRFKIDIDTGQIMNWPNGVSASVHYKVCDDGVYKLLNENEEVVFSKSGYVPDILCPKDEGFGDYIIMDINKEGIIDLWTREQVQYLLQEQ